MLPTLVSYLLTTFGQSTRSWHISQSLQPFEIVSQFFLLPSLVHGNETMALHMLSMTEEHPQPFGLYVD
jgi:hypothetical protein